MLDTTRRANEPADPRRFTQQWDQAYTSFARTYDLAVRLLPVWKTWLKCAVPHIEGPRVLEVSFGTGYLLSRFAGAFETHGLDYNRKLVSIARENLSRAGVHARLVQGNVEAMPYPDSTFDCLVNTMAFSAYPNGALALGEMKRVLRVGGKLILIDVTYPPDRNPVGTRIARFWERSGDIIRDMPALLDEGGFAFEQEPIGAWGSVRLYIATRSAPTASSSMRSGKLAVT